MNSFLDIKPPLNLLFLSFPGQSAVTPYIGSGRCMRDAALSRRSFAGGAVAAAAAALIPAAAAQKTEKPAAMETDLGVKPEGLSDADWDEVRARYANLLRVYGERLSADEKRRAVKILTTNQHMLASIRLFVTQNADASACTLRLYTPQEAKQQI